jgi:hypothetical protein
VFQAFWNRSPVPLYHRDKASALTVRPNLAPKTLTVTKFWFISRLDEEEEEEEEEEDRNGRLARRRAKIVDLDVNGVTEKQNTRGKNFWNFPSFLLVFCILMVFRILMSNTASKFNLFWS